MGRGEGVGEGGRKKKAKAKPSPTRWYWVSTKYATGAIIMRGDVIVDCAPIWRRFFLGKTIEQLCDWNKDIRIKALR